MRFFIIILVIAQFTVFSLLQAIYYYGNVPVTNMHVTPDVHAKVFSQIYFAEQVELLDRKEGWLKIKTPTDGYEGWVQDNTICAGHPDFLAKPPVMVKINRISACVYRTPDKHQKPLLILPFESTLHNIDSGYTDSTWVKVLLPDGRDGYIKRKDVVFDPGLLNIEEMCTLSLLFLGCPYICGGRTSFGYNCSGFIQMLYRQMGYYIPLKAKKQAHWEGFEDVLPKHAKRGDLIFFGKNECDIGHVGLYLGDGQFIHATLFNGNPFVRVNNLLDPPWNGEGHERYRYCTARRLRGLAPPDVKT